MHKKSMTVCPVLKTREMLYRGGFVADDGGEDKVVTIDGQEMIFDDAPVIIGIGSFKATRSGGSDIYDADADRLRIMDEAYNVAVRQSIEDLTKNGATTIPAREVIVEGYKKRGGNDLMKIEKLARDDVRDYHSRKNTLLLSYR